MHILNASVKAVFKATAAAKKGKTDMISGFDDFQKLSQNQVEVAMSSADAVGKAFQAMATETADFSRRSMEQGTAAWEKLASSKSLDKAFEVQSEFVRSAYESYMGQVNKIGAIVADMTKTAYKPYEGILGKYGK